MITMPVNVTRNALRQRWRAANPWTVTFKLMADLMAQAGPGHLQVCGPDRWVSVLMNRAVMPWCRGGRAAARQQHLPRLAASSGSWWAAGPRQPPAPWRHRVTFPAAHSQGGLRPRPLAARRRRAATTRNRSESDTSNQIAILTSGKKYVCVCTLTHD